MFGAIIGDIVGSVYEWRNIKTKDFPLFRKDCFFTDDTVMTVAVADAIMQSSMACGGDDGFGRPMLNREILIDSMKLWGRRYPDSGYGARFGAWLVSENRKPYNSFGNGSAMRVSPCAWVCGHGGSFAACIADVESLAAEAAAVTHNHPEGIKGAVEAARASHLMLCAGWDHGPDRINRCKELILHCSGYDLSRTLDELRPTYRFDESCQGTVPQAITAFLESRDFEDAIRNAISLGGDSDTLAAITGSIAEAAYGIPQCIRDAAMAYLDAPILGVCARWEKFVRNFRAECNCMFS